MTLQELKQALETLGIPVAYHHFKSAVSPPFCVFYREETQGFIADNRNYYNRHNVTIELYTNKKDLVLEGKVETLLSENELPYRALEAYIQDEDMYQVAYEITI